jgi:hypothetical protein
MEQQSIYQIRQIMSTEQIKEVLHRRIEEVDERFLKVMFAMAETYMKELEDAALEAEIEAVAPNPDWKPMTKEELISEIEEANAQIERGEFIDIDDLEKEMEKW